MVLDDNWYTEASHDLGLGFSLRIKSKLHEEQSAYQTIAVYETETFGRLLTIDGLVMLTDRDNFVYHEMMTHPALFTHRNPKKVVIIGGGDCGTLKEVLKHPGVEEAWQVEIDERVTQVSEKYFPELSESNRDPRANFFFGDGIQPVENFIYREVFACALCFFACCQAAGDECFLAFPHMDLLANRRFHEGGQRFAIAQYPFGGFT